MKKKKKKNGVMNRQFHIIRDVWVLKMDSKSQYIFIKKLFTTTLTVIIIKRANNIEYKYKSLSYVPSASDFRSDEMLRNASCRFITRKLPVVES